MGGTVIETESDKIKIRTIIEMGQEIGLDDSEILKKLQEKIIGLPLKQAKIYIKSFEGKGSISMKMEILPF